MEEIHFEAVQMARSEVAGYLNRIGKIEAFNTFTKDDICGLIHAAHKGVEDAKLKLRGASPDDEIPF